MLNVLPDYPGVVYCIIHPTLRIQLYDCTLSAAELEMITAKCHFDNLGTATEACRMYTSSKIKDVPKLPLIFEVCSTGTRYQVPGTR